MVPGRDLEMLRESEDIDSGKLSLETRKDHVSSCNHSLMPELDRQDLALSRGLLGTRQDQSRHNQSELSPGQPPQSPEGPLMMERGQNHYRKCYVFGLLEP